MPAGLLSPSPQGGQAGTEAPTARRLRKTNAGTCSLAQKFSPNPGCPTWAERCFGTETQEGASRFDRWWRNYHNVPLHRYTSCRLGPSDWLASPQDNGGVRGWAPQPVPSHPTSQVFLHSSVGSFFCAYLSIKSLQNRSNTALVQPNPV